MAIHPDGLYKAAGFGDKIRFLNILIGWFQHIVNPSHEYDDDDLENIIALG